ncbi:MAG: bifunctional (p)ppGpp synthetase/guanosine-3',5'-bis(diphosphate) 3'-pyrophosphohydrolase [Gemmatimonadetes bacterium]|nr:bifunctional (p)ppGpp synthetase/guanosine-3',5'-bis(diphosphate) 3'-pyrophosphohydrolase [Gemmatimonadota bacterium]MYG15383.1 bifunctional (p)ppGpp synthetase/guanosine-3',5'-bis(diphosphate) 3'-pyrophosphohydrolase [Gemmatimonadota bacterium]
MTATVENALTHSSIVPVQVLLEQYAISHPEIDSDEALEAQLDLIERAYHFSTLHHAGQVRKSGEPFMVHCTQVVLTLIGLQLDAVTIAAGLLHDVVEDVEEVTIEQLAAEFGEEVAVLVNGVTKITGLSFRSQEELQAEYFRKMLVSMAKDVRIILIKLADRLHNMRTLSFLEEEKQQRISLETREIYAPLAHRFGMAKIKSELEDLSLKYLSPDVYRDLASKLDQKRAEREKLIDEIRQPIVKALKDAGIDATVNGRAKHFHSIYTKMQRRNRPFEEIYDLLALRVVTDTVPNCYHALGIIHTLYTPIFDRFKDYVSRPKMNMYQSLHTTIIASNGETAEIQIRTREMDRIAEVGIAAHWLYKEGREEVQDGEGREDWLSQALDWQTDMTDPKEFMSYLRMDLYDDAIFVFTPRGDLKELPQGASVLDFAFAIHTDIGLHCSGAKVNGNIAPLAGKLQNGDTVTIFTSPHQTPSSYWLDIVKTTKASSKIRSWFRKATLEQSISLGEDMLDRELKRLKVKRKVADEMEALAKEYGLPDANRLYAAIGRGEYSAAQVAQRLLPEEPSGEEPPKTSVLTRFVDRVRRPRGGVKVTGIDNLMIRFAQCCQPVPGDPIIGFITRGRGVTVHNKECANIVDDLERRLEVHWDVEKDQFFVVGLRIFGSDRPGLLNEISRTISDAGINITHAAMDTTDGMADGNFGIEVEHLSQLDRLIVRIKKVKGVDRVERETGGKYGNVSEDVFDHLEQDPGK